MFQEVLAEILSRLETAQSRGLLSGYALIGGFGVSAWGVPRATQDFDFAIAIGQADPQALATLKGQTTASQRYAGHRVDGGDSGGIERMGGRAEKNVRAAK